MDGDRWTLAEAKARFSEVVDRAQRGGAQTVTRHGTPAAVVMSVEEYERLRTAQRSFKEFLLSAPFEKLDLDGPRHAARAVDL
jgi:prevent-host-death family protein